MEKRASAAEPANQTNRRLDQAHDKDEDTRRSVVWVMPPSIVSLVHATIEGVGLVAYVIEFLLR